MAEPMSAERLAQCRKYIGEQTEAWEKHSKKKDADTELLIMTDLLQEVDYQRQHVGELESWIGGQM